MKPQTVYVKVPVKKELPPPKEGVFCTMGDNEFISMKKYFPKGWGDNHNAHWREHDESDDEVSITHWLKPLTAIVFTEEEFEAEKLKIASEAWVDVRERLPDEYKEYIVSGPNVTTMDFTKHGWYSDVLDVHVDQNKITHWMPLPTAPSKEAYLSTIKK